MDKRTPTLAFAQLADWLKHRGYKQHFKKNAAAIDTMVEAFRISPERVNVVRCFLEQARKLPEDIRLRDADVHRLTRNEHYPCIPLTREIIVGLAEGFTTRPHPASLKSTLFFIHILSESDHPIMSEPIIRALTTGLPEMRMFAPEQTPSEAESYRRRLRGDGLYAFMGNPHTQASLQTIISSPLLSDLDSDETNAGTTYLTAVRPSARGPQGGSGFLISRVLLQLENASSEAHKQKYIHTVTESGRGKRIQIRSQGFVVPNSGNDMYVVQFQSGLGSFNISAFPQEQTSLPGGFARGLILTYDAQNNEGIMATRIALFKGKAESEMINDAAWDDIEAYLKLIPDVDVDFSDVLNYLVHVDASFVMGGVSKTSDGDGLDLQEFIEILRNLDEDDADSEIQPSACLFQPLMPYQPV